MHFCDIILSAKATLSCAAEKIDPLAQIGNEDNNEFKVYFRPFVPISFSNS